MKAEVLKKKNLLKMKRVTWWDSNYQIKRKNFAWIDAHFATKSWADDGFANLLSPSKTLMQGIQEPGQELYTVT